MARRSKFGRFQVANEASDPFKHTDVAYNLDNLDVMIGSDHARYGIGDDFNNPSTTAPSGTEYWLAPQDPTVMINFGVRSLYNIVRGLDYNDVPLGAVFAWWRPSSVVALPAGCVPCDGASYTGTDKHSYQADGFTTITVPDLRNAMILGANAAVTDGTTAVTPSTQSAGDGPGIRGTGGTNVPRALTHTHGLNTLAVGAHTHGITDHTHGNQNHFHGMEHIHNTGGPLGGFQFRTAASGGFGIYSDGLSQNGTTPVHTHQTGGIIPAGFWSANTDGSSRTGIGTTIGGGPGATEGMFVPNLATSTASSTAITGIPANALSATEILPKYVGLLYVIKIRKAGPLHNTVFPPGT